MRFRSSSCARRILASGSRAAVELCTECTMLLMCTFTWIEWRCITPPEVPRSHCSAFACSAPLGVESAEAVMLLVIALVLVSGAAAAVQQAAAA